MQRKSFYLDGLTKSINKDSLISFSLFFNHLIAYYLYKWLLKLLQLLFEGGNHRI